MTAGLWAALGYAVGSLATWLALQPVIHERYQRGKADGYLDRFEDEKPSREAIRQAAHLQGIRDGQASLAAVVVRDLGPLEAQRMVERINAMAKVDSILGGKHE